MKMAISTKVMPATLSRCPSQAVSRDDQLRPGSPSMRCGPSSTSRCQATMNIVVGTTSTAFSTMAAIGDSETRPPTMRMTIDMIQGMVTRWKNSRVLAKKKPKLSDSTWLSDSRTIYPRPAFSPALCSAVPSASASRCAALPGRSGLGWDSCGAQPCRKSTSKLAATRPLGRAKRSP